MEIDAVTRSYKRWAPIYDKTFGALTNVGRRRAARYLTGRGGDVLEVGVGTGLALPFYGDGVQVTGVDFSHDMLAKARARVAEQSLNHVAALRQMDARDLQFPDARFDSVAAMHVLSVVPEPEKVLAEIARVCKPGGEVVITNHFAADGGVVGFLERVSQPLENLLGWHSDFEIDTVLQEPLLEEIQRDRLPPMGMMTWLVLRRRG